MCGGCVFLFACFFFCKRKLTNINLSSAILYKKINKFSVLNISIIYIICFNSRHFYTLDIIYLLLCFYVSYLIFVGDIPSYRSTGKEFRKQLEWCILALLITWICQLFHLSTCYTNIKRYIN